jgi:proteasome assembly chaperone (PAC2) family protein
LRRLRLLDSGPRTEVVYEEGMRDYFLEDATFIEGLPGIGMVSKVAVAYILDALRDRAKRICRLYSPEFPSPAFVSDGRLLLNFADLYAIEDPSPTLILYGTSQPSSSYGQHEFCYTVIELVKKHGGRRVFTVGGLGGREGISPRREVFCSSTDKANLEKYARLVEGHVYSGQIVGAVGILMNLAGLMGMENMGMLIEVGESTPDYYACRRAIWVLNRLANLGLGDVSVEELTRSYVRAAARLGG